MGAPTVFDVKGDYGAVGNGATDDTTSLQNAVNAADSAGGGIVWFPIGQYKISSPLVVPVELSKSIILRGAGMRSTYIRPVTDGQIAVRFGAATPDPAGTFTNVTQYCGMEDMSITGAYIASPTKAAIGLQLTELANGWFRNIILEAFPLSSIGLYLLGSTTPVGSGSATAPPVTHCSFHNVLAVTTKRPLVIQNAEECLFEGCSFGLPTGLSGQAADSLFAIEFRQGHNNGFYRTLVQGDTNNLSPNVGILVRAPIRSDGQAGGDNTSHHFHGLVAEGHDICIWQENGNNDGFDVENPNFSIYNTDFRDDAAQAGTSAMSVRAPLHKKDYRDMRMPHSPTITWPTGATTPSVAGGKHFACNNSSATTIRGFADGQDGDSIFVRLDANTTIQNGATIKCPGGSNIVGATRKCVRFNNLVGTWYAETPTQD